MTPQDKSDLAEKLAPKMVQIRGRRLPIEEVWLRSHSAWMARRTRAFYQSEHYQYYIPMARRAIERYTTRGIQLLHPSVNSFEVLPGDEIDLEAGKQADAVRAYMSWLTDTRIPIRRNTSQLMRSILLYTRAIVKNTIQVIDTPVKAGSFSGVIKQIWPSQRVVDPFSFYIWPETAGTVEECQLIFEDCMVSVGEYQSWVEQKLCDPIPQSDITSPEWPYHLTQRLGLSGMTNPTDVPSVVEGISAGKGPDDPPGAPQPPPSPHAFLALSEAWFKVKNRWVLSWIVSNVQGGPRCVRLEQAPYPEAPYRMATARPIPNEHYTNSLMDDIEPLQILLNDQFNQTEEARSVAAMPPIIVDVNAVNRMDSLQYGPRRVWKMENVNQAAARALDIPDQPSLTGVRALQMTMGLMNSVGAQAPSMDGQPTRNAPRGSTAFNSLMQAGMADVQDMAQILETEIMTPSLGDFYRLTLAFVPPSQVIQIPGSQEFKPTTRTVNDLVGNWTFKWVGTLQAQNQQVKNQQLMVFAQLLAKASGTLKEQGWAVNWGILGKRLWREGLGERGVEQIIIPISELAKVNPAAADMMAQQQGPHVIPPKVNISLKGDLSPQMAADLTDGTIDGKPPVTATMTAPVSGAGTPPTGAHQSNAQMDRAQTTQTIPQSLAGLSQ